MNGTLGAWETITIYVTFMSSVQENKGRLLKVF